MKQIDKNTVSAKNQLEAFDKIKIINPEGSGVRIMFLGNSITLHAPKTEIGWDGFWGMAASSEENDYVHLLMKSVGSVTDNAAFCICQAADWEKDYKNLDFSFDIFERAKNFGTDIIIVRLIENCPFVDFDNECFKKQLMKLLNYLSNGKDVKVILTTSFWYHNGDTAIIELAKEQNLPLVELGDLGELDEMKAVGLFEHNGVANHPGDKGMKHIADRIFGRLKEMI